MLGIVGLALLATAKATDDVTFHKVSLDRRFVAEGVAVGDVNRDHRLDIVAGNVWYEAPNWKPHEIAPVVQVEPKSAYSNCFHTWLADLDHDGWLDQIVIGMPGDKVVWRRNPGKSRSPWKESLVWHSACNESPLFEDLTGSGRKVLVMGTDYDRMAWFEPGEKPEDVWVCHAISESKGAGAQRYSHGLGIGDVNGDGRQDVLTTMGYYLAPKDRKQTPWAFIKADLGPDCGQIRVLSSPKGVLTTSAHARGVWWHRWIDGKFEKSTIDDSVSETHATNLVLLGRPARWNLVTGKRKWAHPPGVDVGSEEDSLLLRYEAVPEGKSLKWERHVIDRDSGVGTQFVTQDVDNDRLADIVTANKNGVFLFLQRK